MGSDNKESHKERIEIGLQKETLAGVKAGVIVGLLESILWTMSRFLSVVSGELPTLTISPTMQVFIAVVFVTSTVGGGIFGYAYTRVQAKIPVSSPYLKAGVFGVCVWVLPPLASWLLTEVGHPVLDSVSGGLGAIIFAYLSNKWTNTTIPHKLPAEGTTH
jgi:hypothetical protein